MRCGGGGGGVIDVVFRGSYGMVVMLCLVVMNGVV